MADKNGSLKRRLGPLALAATGICSMVGASIHVVPFMIQKNVPGVGPWVALAFLGAAVPAILAAVAYAALSSAMPRAGGSYVFASRGFSPFAGFIASFSQWFGLSIAIGVISYIIPAFLRDFLDASGFEAAATWLTGPVVRPVAAVAILWLFVYINIRGANAYSKTLLPLMWLMFASGLIVMIAAFLFKPLPITAGGAMSAAIPFDVSTFLSAVSVMFASFIGFDSIAQAGGEAMQPKTNLPRAIAFSVGGVLIFYISFTVAVYHLVPWQVVAAEAQHKDITAPGLLAAVLPFGWTLAILAGATIALLNDLPGMLLSVSRLFFAWGKDGIFPAFTIKTHPHFHTPYMALVISGVMATVGIVGSHFAGSFFLGIDIMVTAMLVNYGLICATLLTIWKYNPALSRQLDLFSIKTLRLAGWSGLVVLLFFLVVHVKKDFHTQVSAWYFRSTWVYLLVMVVGAGIFYTSSGKQRQQFRDLPD
jgi:amino acid transporter